MKKLSEDITGEFKLAAASSGVDALKNIKFEQEEIEGGLADDKSVKDIAKKHNVNIKDIVDQIKKGTKIEMEHTDDPKEAKEIAMDHEMEHPYYYSALEDMEKELEEGSLLMNSIIGEEELDEATTGASSGAFVGPMSGKPIKRTVYKTDVPVSGAGGMTKPIGKMRSFKKKQLKETNVISKQEIIDESLGMASIPTYDSPAGWGDNEFMGTKGKKGKAPVNKGVTHKKTMRPDYKFVTIKDKCNEFPYCDQGPDAISINESLYEEIAKKTNRTIEDVKKIINNKNK